MRPNEPVEVRWAAIETCCRRLENASATKLQPFSPARPGGGGAGGGGGGTGHDVPAGTAVPSGHTVGGGGGGGGGSGQGCVAGICDPSGQVCIAGGGGVVAHAATTTVAPRINGSRLILFSLQAVRFGNENSAAVFLRRARCGAEAAPAPPPGGLAAAVLAGAGLALATAARVELGSLGLLFGVASARLGN